MLWHWQERETNMKPTHTPIIIDPAFFDYINSLAGGNK